MTKPLLIRALLREPVECTPIWLMRQAGRYLPEYRALRATVTDFLDLCQRPDVACEITLQPLRRFGLDAAIIFSDILTIPHAMGLELRFIEGQGPCFNQPIRHRGDIKRLRTLEPEVDLAYVLEAIRLVRHELPAGTPLIGFCGSPWTVAAYMLEGKANKNFPALQQCRVDDPASLHHLLDHLAQAIQAHLNAQIRAGADVVMLFDTWGGLLPAELYETFSLRYLRQIIAGLHRQKDQKAIPVILFAKGCHGLLAQLATSGCDALGIDEQIDIRVAMAQVGDRVALQGNLAPDLLYENPDAIVAAVTTLLTAYGNTPGHVVNLGHGIKPDMPPEHVAVLVDAVHRISRKLRGANT